MPVRELPPGALTGTPTEAELDAAIRDNLRRFGDVGEHDEMLYVIADGVGNVLRSGRVRGDEEQAHALVA